MSVQNCVMLLPRYDAAIARTQRNDGSTETSAARSRPDLKPRRSAAEASDALPTCSARQPRGRLD